MFETNTWLRVNNCVGHDNEVPTSFFFFFFFFFFFLFFFSFLFLFLFLLPPSSFFPSPISEPSFSLLLPLVLSVRLLVRLFFVRCGLIPLLILYVWFDAFFLSGKISTAKRFQISLSSLPLPLPSLPHSPSHKTAIFTLLLPALSPPCNRIYFFTVYLNWYWLALQRYHPFSEG